MKKTILQLTERNKKSNNFQITNWLKGYLILCLGISLATIACSSPGMLQDKAARTFVNPIAEGADPWVFEKDGHYFYCGSNECKEPLDLLRNPVFYPLFTKCEIKKYKNW